MSTNDGVGFAKPPPLSDAIFRHIGRAIVEGKLRPNQRLIETQLCAEFGCSRSPLREALRMLAAEGLIEFSPRRGARVSQLTPKTLRDVFEVRVLLEGLAARLAAEHATEENVSALRGLSERMREIVAGDGSQDFFELNNEFHSRLARIGGNAFLTSLQETAANRTFLPLFLFLSGRRHLELAAAAHGEIVDAIARSDAAGAEEAMRRHIRQIQSEAEAIVVAQFGSGPVDSGGLVVQ